MALPTTPPRRFVLAVGGAFNPIHTQHIALLNAARQAILDSDPSHENAEFCGLIACAPDGYVRAKLGSGEAISAFHRLEMIKLALTESEEMSGTGVAATGWIQRPVRTFGSAQQMLDAFVAEDKKLRQQEHQYSDAASADASVNANALSPWEPVLVVGGDRAHPERAVRKQKYLVVMVARQGDTERLRVQFERVLETPQAHGRLFFVERELEDISSTKVRRALHRILAEEAGSDSRMREYDDLSQTKWLHESVQQYAVGIASLFS